MVLETFSVSHQKASAYLPEIELLHGYFAIDTGDDLRKRREKVTGRVVALDRGLEDTLPYLFALLGIVEGIDPLAQMDGQVKKRRTLEAIKRILLRESLNQPLMVIFEDLQWIDDETQALLNLLAHSIGTAKVLLLVNYRPEYSHQWSSKTYYTQLRLDPLGKESAEEMLSAMLGDGQDLDPLKRVIVEKTEGNPLFMEEIVQSMFEDGALVRNGTVKLVKSLNQLRIPPTVQGILAARIDRLPAAEKDLLQTLAVIGREFSLGLLRLVVTKSDEELSRMLAALQLAEFIYEQPATGDVEFIFKHALTQEVALASLLNERRKVLHERAGEAVEALFADHLDDHITELVHHFTQSANADRAVRYLALARKQSFERAAYAESQAQLRQGLEWIIRLPESIERDARELELASALAGVLLFTRGPAAPETRVAAERARALAEKSGNLAQLILQVSAIRAGVFVSGDHSGGAALADQILDLAQREGTSEALASAHGAQLQVCFYRGDLVGAEQHFALLSGLIEAAGTQIMEPMRLETVVVAMAYAGFSVWFVGHAEKARERIAQAIAIARDSKDPFRLAVAQDFEGYLYRWLREPQRAAAVAAQALALSEEHGFPHSRNMARTVMGWARAQLGSAGEGVFLIRQGIAGLAGLGARANITDHLTRLAEAQVLDGMLDDALITIEDALQANPEELIFRPHILNCRGELRLTIGQLELAEPDFREAIALAQKMSAKAIELRATTSLARLMRDTCRRDNARALLAEIYNWFTEGFDTADLKEAKALLDDLNV
jgi:tetratricopeptide (TPR) repeat protein